MLRTAVLFVLPLLLTAQATAQPLELDPDCTVTVGDQSALVRPDGTFETRCFDPGQSVNEWIIDGESAWSALLDLGRAHDFFVCVEDLQEGTDSPLETGRIFMEFHETPLEQIVQAIMWEYDAYHWHFDSDVLNLTRKALQPENNPFETAVEGFQFKGTPDDFLGDLIHLVPGYLTSRLRVFQVGRDEPEIQFEVQPGSLREALNAFSRASGMGWYAEVTTEPKKLTLEGPSHAPQELGSFRWINFSFIHMRQVR